MEPEDQLVPIEEVFDVVEVALVTLPSLTPGERLELELSAWTRVFDAGPEIADVLRLSGIGRLLQGTDRARTESDIDSGLATIVDSLVVISRDPRFDHLAEEDRVVASAFAVRSQVRVLALAAGGLDPPASGQQEEQ